MIGFSILALVVSTASTALPPQSVPDRISAVMYEDDSGRATIHADAGIDGGMPSVPMPGSRWRCVSPTIASFACRTRFRIYGRPVRVTYNDEVGDVVIHISMGNVGR